MRGKIVLSDNEGRLWPDSRFFINRFSTQGVQIEQHRRTREWRCNCGEFQSHNTLTDHTKYCSHLEMLGLPGGGEPFEATITLLSGFRLRVARKRARAKEDERKRLPQPGKVRVKNS